MIEQGISKIQELVEGAMKVQEFMVNGRRYTDRSVVEQRDPLDKAETVGTLTGFSDLVKVALNGQREPQNFIHVLNPNEVCFAAVLCDEWGQRQIDIHAKLPAFGRFAFGEYMDQERFIIGLQAFFQPTKDIAYLQQIAGTLKAEQVNISDDDGTSQRVAMRSGVVLAETVTVKKLVTLRPWRTFREIEQPASTFIFRLKNVKDAAPLLSLHVADGEVWQIEAMQSIKTLLAARHPGVAVVA